MAATSTSAGAAQVFPASPYLAGFDIDGTLTTSSAQGYYVQGYRFCVRYVSLDVPEAPQDLSAQEVEAILASGLALMAVQHVDDPGWMPTPQLGNDHGSAAGTNAAAAGIPQGVSVFLDLEGVASRAPADDVIAYCQAWYAAVAAAGYLPGLYVGYDCGLTAAQLSGLPFQGFWKAPGDWPVPSQGYQMCQGQTVGAIDPDITYPMSGGTQIAWVAASAPTYPTLQQSQQQMTAVMALQEALNAASANPQLGVDGYFGPETDAAVRSFQQREGLPVTGIVDARTWSMLAVEEAPSSSQPPPSS